jgi:phosphoribosylaminoimidazole carboxylase PurE protein
MSATDLPPRVGIVMGSASDLEVMRRASGLLDELNVAWEMRILSAHRTPAEAGEYAASARDRGLKVLIAGAGMSAALPGVLAAGTLLPVIGVPVSSGPLVGMDAALAILQMPPGIPVGTMAIGSAGARNAALYAAAILAVEDKPLAGRLADYRRAQAEKVLQADRELQGS